MRHSVFAFPQANSFFAGFGMPGGRIASGIVACPSITGLRQPPRSAGVPGGPRRRLKAQKAPWRSGAGRYRCQSATFQSPESQGFCRTPLRVLAYAITEPRQMSGIM